jgi:hypothetical protein
MKFFSNDAKETTEDQAHDDRDQAAPGSVEAESAAVPQQRAGSPWNDAPGTDTDLSRDDSPRDEPSTDELRSDEHRSDDGQAHAGGDEPFRSDEDSTTTAHTDPVDLPLDDHDETRDRTASGTDHQGFGDRTDSDLGAGESRDDVDERDGLGDRPVPDAQTYGPDGTVTPATGPSADENDAVRDEGDFDSPQAVEPVTGEPLDGHDDTDPVATGVDDHLHDEDVTDTSADFEPAAVAAVPAGTTSADEPDSDTADADVAPVAVPADVVPVAVPADKTPGSVEEPKIDRLFTDGDSFAERFRDIQLRFVDSPKDATAEAAALVGEAVDRLTSALKSQHEGISSKSDDTERLRVELRGYRDMLNRLTGL